jgi:hypothetical protein
MPAKNEIGVKDASAVPFQNKPGADQYQGCQCRQAAKHSRCRHCGDLRALGVEGIGTDGYFLAVGISTALGVRDR